MPKDSFIDWSQAALGWALPALEPRTAARERGGQKTWSEELWSSSHTPPSPCSGGCQGEPLRSRTRDPVAEADDFPERLFSSGPLSGALSPAEWGSREVLVPGHLSLWGTPGAVSNWSDLLQPGLRGAYRPSSTPSREKVATTPVDSSWPSVSSDSVLGREDEENEEGASFSFDRWEFVPVKPTERTVCQRLLLWMNANGYPYEIVYADGHIADWEFDAEVIGKGDDDVLASRIANREFDPTPTEATQANPAEYVDQLEPQGSRLMLAISQDRKSWFKTGMVVMNCGSVPCLAVEKDQAGVETLYLFFCASVYEIAVLDPGDPIRFDAGRRNRPTPLCVAYTTDLRNWTYRLLGERPRDDVTGDTGFIYPDLSDPSFDFEGFDFDLEADAYTANDPSVVRKHDGTGWLMYYTLHYGAEKRSMILVAEAEHLYDFTWITREDAIPVVPTLDRIIDEGANAEDPNVGRTAMGYRLYASGPPDGNNSWQADLDADGTLIEDSLNTIEHTCDGDTGGPGPPYRPVVLCNAVGGSSKEWLAFVFQGDADYQRHIVSVKVDFLGNIVGGTYESGGECNVLLNTDDGKTYEYDGIREAAVARFGGCWVMVYTTGIPG